MPALSDPELEYIPDFSKGSPNRFVMLGVSPTRPTLFYDFDNTPVGDILDYGREHYMNFDIYESSPGRYHFVARMANWDLVQERLFELKRTFPHENYILNAHRLRLRISGKWKEIDSQESYHGFPVFRFHSRLFARIVPPPHLYRCEHNTHGHIDERLVYPIFTTYTAPIRDL